MDRSTDSTLVLARAACVTSLALMVAAVWLDAAEAHPGPQPVAEDETPVDFGRDIRPLLSDNCFFCHGPDESKLEGDLRLDLKDEAFRDLGGYFALVPGRSTESELFLRISDADDRMPPEDSGKELTAEEVELIRRWIDQGAPWEEHWSYLPVRRAELPPEPAVENPASHNALDRFIQARLETEGLVQEPEASRETLIRRVSLDLTGLPPTIDEVEAFLADEDPGAYERLVERLFASPRYGEHMARAWLDAARYGDTHGYHLDNLRVMWPYRDWVIAAFNANMPFDQFTIEQLAGDLLPEPSVEQRVATGFNRCNPTSAEGGMIADEFMTIYAVDRVVTTSTVWMGTTMLCAQCHDHKFDPISQKDFYEVFSFFNNISESASDGNAPSPPPTIPVPSDAQRMKLDELQGAIAAGEAELEAPLAEIDAAQTAWEAEWTRRIQERWHAVDPVTFAAESGAGMRLLEDGSILVEGDEPEKDVYEVLFRTDVADVTAIRLQALADDGLPARGPGRAPNGNFVLSGFEVRAVAQTEPGALAAIPMEAALASYAQPDYPVAGAIDPDVSTGWGVHQRNTDHEAWFLPVEPFGTTAGSLVQVRLRFESQHSEHQIGRFRIEVADEPTLREARLGPWFSLGPFEKEQGKAAYDEDFGPETGVVLTQTFADGTLAWVEQPDWAEGEIHDLTGEQCATYAYRTIESPDDRTLSLSLGSDDAVKVWLNGELLLDERAARSIEPDQNRVDLALVAGENHILLKVVNYGGGFAFTTRRMEEGVGGLPISVAGVLADPARSADEQRELRDFYRRTNSPEWKAMSEEVAELRDSLAALDAEVPLALVMEENEEPRQAYLLTRGRYDRRTDEVQPGTPAFLPPLEATEGERPTRLDFAEWLVDPEHPLTARVTVNRYWQNLFGTGLVKTAEDFGSQGEWPSHPELLDWLASEFVASGWDVEHMLRLMVTSATYRQSATTTPEKRALDPRNRLLARGPRQRLNAERIRDAALYAGGLLVEQLGGPSVKPYQPGGIWKVVGYTSSNTANFVRDEGEALYRRSLYTFWKRTAPPPSMQIFDAPTREACTVERATTNTPLQALALLNDEQFVEAARGLAQRVLREGPAATDDRLTWAFRTVTARKPTTTELVTLKTLLETTLTEYRADAESARALLSVGESSPDPALDAAELAAWTHVTNLLLNLDEFVTKG